MQRTFLIVWCATLSCGAWNGAAAAEWPQFGYDVAHSSYNAAEKGYPTATGNTLVAAYGLGVMFPNSSFDSAPILLNAVSEARGRPPRQMLYLTTRDGRTIAVDVKDGAVLWSQKPTPGQFTSDIRAGVTGSPAADSARRYVYAFGLDGNVHKYDSYDGTETLTNGTTAGKTSGWPQIVTIKPQADKLGAAVAINTVSGGATYLYAVTNGNDGDEGDYQGHLTTVNLATSLQSVFNAACSNLAFHFVAYGETSGQGQNDCATVRDGIWGRPGAVYDPGTNRVFISTANGPFNANNGGWDWGDSVLALNPDGTGAGGGMPVDSYTPATYQYLEQGDLDLGSGSIAIVPPPPGTAPEYRHIAVQVGKDACVRLLNIADLSGQGGPAHVGGELSSQNLYPGNNSCGSASDVVIAQPAVWVNPADFSSWVYVAGKWAAVVAYKIVLNGAGKPSLVPQWTWQNPGSTSPVVANGVVYVASFNLTALDAVTGSKIWSDTSTPAGMHWASPIVVNSHIYIVDYGGKLKSYLLDGIFRNGYQ